MSGADECRCEEEGPPFDREGLALDIELILKGDARAADILARMLDGFRQAIEGGLRGINQTRGALSAAVELSYMHSRSHSAALRLYRLSLEGQLKVEDEPVRLIGAAIERSTARPAAASGGAGRTRAKGR